MLKKFVGMITKFFPIWVVLFSAIAFLNPAPLKPFSAYIPWLLGLVMLGMGLTMTPQDFKLVLMRPKDVAFGVVLRYLIMPLVAFGVAKILELPSSLAAGLILVGCCPSGTASNVITFIAKGDTALSVTISSVNTILAPLLTPFIFLALVDTVIPIQASALLIDILKIVLLPIIIGVMLRIFFSRAVEHVMIFIPLVSIASIVFIIAIIIALSVTTLASVATIAFLAVVIHNALGLGLGYGASRFAGMSHKKAKAVSCEVGIENSGLAVALAIAHLDPIAAIPGAIFSVWHNMSGSLLASYWQARDKD
jgi:BASS family bile acid:Na+ symporter